MTKYVVCASSITLNIVYNQMMRHKSFQHNFQRECQYKFPYIRFQIMQEFCCIKWIVMGQQIFIVRNDPKTTILILLNYSLSVYYVFVAQSSNLFFSEFMNFWLCRFNISMFMIFFTYIIKYINFQQDSIVLLYKNQKQ